MIEEFTAEDARKISNSLDNRKHSEELEKIMSCIKNKANEGEKSYFCFSLSKPVEIELEKRGFDVTFTVGDHSDPRESDFYTISW